ncbi:MAG: Gx transporter family protein [Clostridia bacterium]|nr:Gx transporter family protein [Clostridia bacterium]
MSSTKKLTFLGVLASVALILSYIEAILPPIYAAVPGIKVGLPNVVILFLLYRYGVKEAAAVSFIRLIVSMMLFGSPTMFIYSLAGAVLSLIFMAILKKTKLFSSIGVSVVGGVMHNLGQVLCAMFLLETAEIGYYMFVLVISGTLAGIFIGLLGGILLDKLNAKKH